MHWPEPWEPYFYPECFWIPVTHGRACVFRVCEFVRVTGRGLKLKHVVYSIASINQGFGLQFKVHYIPDVKLVTEADANVMLNLLLK